MKGKPRFCLMAVLAALAAVVLIAAGCGDDDDDKSGLDTVSSGKLTVGSDIPYKPFEFGEPPYEGFDIDVVNEVAKRTRLEPEYRKAAFDTIFRDLAQRKFDAVASATTITPEREKEVDFSVPYFPADQSVLVKKGSEIKNVDQLGGKVVGAQSGTTGADYAKEKTRAESVRTYEQIDDAFNALEAGQIEAVINDFPVSKYAEQEKKDLVVVQVLPTGEQYGIAFAKNSDELREKVNDALVAMKRDGAYARIYRKWFKQDPPAGFLRD